MKRLAVTLLLLATMAVAQRQPINRGPLFANGTGTLSQEGLPYPISTASISPQPSMR